MFATEKLRDSWWSNHYQIAIMVARKEDDDMKFMIFDTIFLIFNLAIMLAIGAVIVYLVYLLIKVLKKYIMSEPVRKEKDEKAKSLGEIIKKYRTECKMTQEFVAETLGVSRQAVSKWESGVSDPSTTNLMALAKLFGVTAEEILKEAQ